MADTRDGRRRRRRYSEEFKVEVVSACRAPGVSVAAVALAHGLNANLLRRWITERPAGGPGKAVVASRARADSGDRKFIPVSVNRSPVREDSIRIELARGDVRATVSWPVSDGSSCRSWLRELFG